MSDTYGDNTGYRFGAFTLDLSRGQLLRDGMEVRIRPRSFDVLRYLVEHQGRLVSRDELLDSLWAGSVVTEDAVTQCLIDVRKALGDVSQTMVRTVPRRGYVFELEVEPLASGHGTAEVTQSGTTTRRWAVGVLLLILAVASIALLAMRDQPVQDTASDGGYAEVRTPSIAVMPFESMGPDTGDSYFADGISEEIINSLARQQGMKVIARTSSFSFRDQNVDVPTIAARLDVSHVLEGSVRRDGDALRINVQLVDARSGEYVWNAQYERALSATSIFAIQSDIAGTVVRSLRTELTAEEEARLSRIPTENMDALDAYFEARQAMETRRAVELDRAAELLRAATDIDPEFALAYVALAETVRLQSAYGSLSRQIANDHGLAAVRRALELDERLGEAYASLGNILAIRADYPGAEEAYLRGIELSPSYAPLYQWYGEFLWIYVARPDEAVSYSRIAVALDPRSAIINRDYALTLIAVGRFDDAMVQYDAVIDIDPEFAPVYQNKGELLYEVLGQIADAIPLIEKTRSMSPESPLGPHALGRAYMDLGDYDKALFYLDEAHTRAPGNPWVTATKARLYALRGDTGASLESAARVLGDYPWQTESLRLMRDHEIETRGVDAAIDHFRRSFSHLLGEETGVVGPSNYMQAIDLAYALVLDGRHDRAEQLLQEVQPFLEGRPRITWFGSPIADVKVQAILGNVDEAISLLREAVDDGWRDDWRFELEHDLALAELRGRPEYDAIIATIEADIDQQRRRVNDD